MYVVFTVCMSHQGTVSRLHYTQVDTVHSTLHVVWADQSTASGYISYTKLWLRQSHRLSMSQGLYLRYRQCLFMSSTV